MLRPRLRLPIWVAAAVVFGAWAARGVMRGGDFSVNALDLVVLGMMVVALLIVSVMRAREARDTQDGEAQQD